MLGFVTYGKVELTGQLSMPEVISRHWNGPSNVGNIFI